MNKSTIDFQQFSLAPRRKATEQAAPTALLDPDGIEQVNNREVAPEDTAEHDTVLPKFPEHVRRKRSAKRAQEQQDTRRRLKSLKRAKDRAIKFYVNVPLDQAMKERLVRASHENEVKMTVIMQAAIDAYLEDNGY